MSTIAKIDITINQDWSKVISIHNDIKKRWQDGKLNKFKKEISMVDSAYTSAYADAEMVRYDFGNSGSFLPQQGNSEVEPMVSSLSGPIFTSQLSWISKLKEDFKELEPSFSLQETNGCFDRHKDGEVKDSKKKHCKLNWVIEDGTGNTYSEDDDGSITSYPNLKGGYLLDTTKFHWVECADTRYVFTISFHEPFDKVLSWLNDHPNLVYSQ